MLKKIQGKKKYIFLTITIIFFFICFFIFFPLKTEVVAPNCVNEGYTIKKSLFGVEYVYNKKAPLGHAYENGICKGCHKESNVIITDVKIFSDKKEINELKLSPNSKANIEIEFYDCNGLVDYDFYSFVCEFEEYYSNIEINDLEISVGNVIGKVNLNIVAFASNKISFVLPIIISNNNEDMIESVSVEFEKDNIFIEGQILSKNDFKVWGYSIKGQIQILDYVIDSTPLNVNTKLIKIKYKDFEIEKEITVLPKSLVSLTIKSAPVKTSYYSGQYFDPKGLIVFANYEFISEEVKPVFKETALSKEDKEIILSYTYNGITKTTSQPISVSSKKTIEINNVDILINDNVVTSYDLSLPDNQFTPTLLINNDKTITQEQYGYDIVWSFVGESYGSFVTENGDVTISNFIGNVELLIEVTGSNYYSKKLPIKVEYDEEKLKLDTIYGKIKDNATYIEGQYFDCNDVSVWGIFKSIDKPVRILDYEYDSQVLTKETTELKFFYKNKVAIVPIAVNDKNLQSIEIIKYPNKSEYYDGQQFDYNGILLKANFEYVDKEVTPNIQTKELKLGDKEVEISYTYREITKTINIPISVVPKKLLSISVNSDNVQKYYTQYDSFNSAGLIVYGIYDYFGEIKIEDFTYDNQPLLTTDKNVNIYVNNGETLLSHKINVIVSTPYEKVVRIKVLNPLDIKLSWIYEYKSNDSSNIIDYNSYLEHNLIYDKTNGLFDIPIGASVTLMIRNPIVIGLIINGKEKFVDRNSSSITFDIIDPDDITIGIIEMAGEHSVVRFIGDNKEQCFVFSNSWDCMLSKDNVDKVFGVFKDTEQFYYSYFYNGMEIRFDELINIKYEKDSIIDVIKNSYSDESSILVLHSLDNITYNIRVSLSDDFEIPIISLPLGYYYDGFSLSENGERLTYEEIRELMIPGDTVHLYLCIQEEDINYENMYIIEKNNVTVIEELNDSSQLNAIKLVGSWESKLSDKINEYLYTITFKSNGIFLYDGYINGELNCTYSGKYRLSGNKIVIISADSTMDIMLVSNTDFSISAEGQIIKANMLEIYGENLIISMVQFERK